MERSPGTRARDAVGRLRSRFVYERLRPELSLADVAARVAPTTAVDDGAQPFTRLLEAHQAQTPPALWHHAPPALPETIERARRGEWTLLGRTLTVSPETDWHRDPFFGARWPQHYVGAVSYHQPGGDLVTLWHQNKMLFLLELAEAYHTTREPAFAARIYALIDSWCVANPYLVGINWASPMDIGTRVAAWSQSLAAIRAAAAPSEEVTARIVRSVIRQLEYLAAHMSQWPVPNNHLIGEAATLFVCGAYWPMWRDAATWMERGESVLVSEAERQILADGVQYEASINYHAYALDFFLFYLHAKALRAEVPSAVVLERTRAMATACLELIMTSGRRPRIGDDTIDRFFVLEHALDTPPLLAHDVVFRDALRPAYARLFEQTDWGRELLGIRVPTRHARHFPQAGLSIARDSAASLLFVHGPQHRGIYSHGHLHADAGSFELEMDGNPLFIDAGTYVYFADAPAREYFKSGRAHNAPIVDDVEPMRSLEPFRWESVAVGEYLGFGAAADAVAVGSRRKLHGAGGAPLEHIRTVVLTRGTALVVDAIRADAFAGTSHLARIGFRTPTPPGTASVAGTQVSITDPRRFARIVEAFSNQRIQVELIDDPNDRAGWYSPQYGELKRGVAVRINAEFESSVVVLSAVRHVDVGVVPVRLDEREVEIAIEAHGERRVTRVVFDPFSVVVGGVTVAGHGADRSMPSSEGARDGHHETPAWLDELTLGS